MIDEFKVNKNQEPKVMKGILNWGWEQIIINKTISKLHHNTIVRLLGTLHIAGRVVDFNELYEMRWLRWQSYCKYYSQGIVFILSK